MSWFELRSVAEALLSQQFNLPSAVAMEQTPPNPDALVWEGSES